MSVVAHQIQDKCASIGNPAHLKQTKRSLRSSRRFPAFVDAKGLRVTVHVTKAGIVQFRSQSNRKREISLSKLWHVLVSPDLFREAVENADRAARNLIDVRQLAFGNWGAEPGQEGKL